MTPCPQQGHPLLRQWVHLEPEYRHRPHRDPESRKHRFGCCAEQETLQWLSTSVAQQQQDQNGKVLTFEEIGNTNTKGASGPTTLSSQLFSLAKLARAAKSLASTEIFSSLGSVAVPALPVQQIPFARDWIGLISTLVHVRDHRHRSSIHSYQCLVPYASEYHGDTCLVCRGNDFIVLIEPPG